MAAKSIKRAPTKADTGFTEDEKAAMREREVGLSGEVYELPLHAQPVFEPWAAGSYPGADLVCSRQICLPVSARMTEDDAKFVVESLARCLPVGV